MLTCHFVVLSCLVDIRTSNSFKKFSWGIFLLKLKVFHQVHGPTEAPSIDKILEDSVDETQLSKNTTKCPFPMEFVKNITMLTLRNSGCANQTVQEKTPDARGTSQRSTNEAAGVCWQLVLSSIHSIVLYCSIPFFPTCQVRVVRFYV